MIGRGSPEKRASALQTQVALLRMRVESAAGRPAVVVVTSALEGDGKSLCAYTLAESLTKTGHSVALADTASESSPNASGDTNEQRLSLVRVPDRPSPQPDDLVAFVEELRARNDYTIVDTDPLVKTSNCGALLRVADAIVIAVRLGRPPTDIDQFVVKTIEEAGKSILGVVAASAPAIAEFRTRRSTGKLVPAWERHNLRPESSWPGPAPAAASG